MTEKFNSTDTLLGISADGCNGNTGVDNGMIRQYELLKGKAVQWLICFYHLCELAFRAVFTTVGKLSKVHFTDEHTGAKICVVFVAMIYL